MMFTRSNNQSMNVHQHQRGVALFFALISLVIMSLAAVSLIRSVDTNSRIAGNLSFKQTADSSSSYGVEALSESLGTAKFAFNESNYVAKGYYAVCNQFDAGTANPCNGLNLTLDSSWKPNSSSKANISGIITNGVDAYGNTIEYIAERMCTSEGAYNSANCLLSDGASRIKNNGIQEQEEPTGNLPTPVYRVTVRVSGPKNTVSYIQTFIS